MPKPLSQKPKVKGNALPAVERIGAINFRVPVSFKKEFKVRAALNEVTQSELLQQIFEEWKQRHG